MGKIPLPVRVNSAACCCREVSLALVNFFTLKVVVFTRRIIALISARLISVWLAVELNTMGLLVLIKNEARPKYFLSQWLGSCFILLGVVWSETILVFLGASIKCGVAPLHFWVPQVIEKIDWFAGGLLCT